MAETTAVTVAGSNPGDEAGSLGQAMAEAYRRSIEFARDRLGVAPAVADREARGLDLRADEVTGLAARPAREMTWSALGKLAERRPDLAEAAWEQIKAEARDELASGHRAAEAVEYGGEPWQRARFAALRAALIEELQPRGGLELMLIDIMATAQTEYLNWLRRHHVQAVGEGEVEDHRLRQVGAWLPPRIEIAAAIEQSAAMADRHHRLFIRTLRAFREQRRMATGVVVQQAGQVNVGGQQVNFGGSIGSAVASGR